MTSTHTSCIIYPAKWMRAFFRLPQLLSVNIHHFAFYRPNLIPFGLSDCLGRECTSHYLMIDEVAIFDPTLWPSARRVARADTLHLGRDYNLVSWTASCTRPLQSFVKLCTECTSLYRTCGFVIVSFFSVRQLVKWTVSVWPSFWNFRLVPRVCERVEGEETKEW